jgi:8-oxo-dGTP diphosphatase
VGRPWCKRVVVQERGEAGPASCHRYRFLMPVQPLICTAAIILDDRARLFLHRRAPGRRLFPNAWDIVGGHVEPGEAVEDALRREVHEETGWQVARILDRLPPVTWCGNDGLQRLEYDFVVAVDGDLGAPRLEVGKHTEQRWVTVDELDLLLENRTVDEDLIRWMASVAHAVRRWAAGSGAS